MATERLRYVDTDVVGGAGNGTSWANAYASLNAAEQAGDATGNIAGSDEYVIFTCRGVTLADTAAVNVSGWTTGATQYIEIRGEPSDKTSSNTGIWSTERYRLVVSNAIALWLSEEFVRVNDLQIEIDSPAANLRRCIYADASGASSAIMISNSLLKQHGGSTYYCRGIDLNHTNITAYIWNCIVYNPSTASNSAANAVNLNVNTASVYNCTLHGCQNSLNVTAGTVHAVNCYASMTVSNAYNGSFATFTKCASNDATGSEAGLQNIAHNTTQFTSVTDPHDYRLPGTGSALYNTGTDGPFAAPLDYTTDIQGDTRTSTWDIGADEYVAAGGGLTAALADSNTISDALGGFLTYRASIGDDANA